MATTTSWVEPTNFNGSIAQGVSNGGSYTGSALPISMGSTGQTTLPLAFTALFETVATTTGDLIYGGTSGTPTRLASGTSGYYLQSTGAASAPTWAAVSGSGTATPTASTNSQWDANVNMNANNFLPLSTTTTAASGTTTLSITSTQNQVVIGTANQTIQLPNNTTGTNVRAGLSYTVSNFTTYPGTAYYVTVQTATPSVLAILGPQQTATFTSMTTSGTGALGWAVTSCTSAPGTQTTATAGGTTTLTAASSTTQVFTGVTTQNCVLPSNITAGQGPGYTYRIYNNSTGSVTVKTATAVTLATISPSTALKFVILSGVDTASGWQIGLA